MIYRHILRPALFLFDPESVHQLAMGALHLGVGLPIARAGARRVFQINEPCLRQDIFGLHFKNPVGLAAGFDKNAQHIRPLTALGFGAIEVGTITAQAQPGNLRPRLFRLAEDAGLLNRMGFNNHGSETVARRLAHGHFSRFQRRPGEKLPILGINIGKTKKIRLKDAPDDYEQSLRRLYEFADYFVINISSPNTPGLRDLQSRAPLTELLRHLARINAELAELENRAPRPLLLKISPDLSDTELDELLDVVHECAVDGIIATNTTIDRDTLKTPGQAALGRGGVSGKPVRRRSLEIIARIYQKTQGELPIIGVGGVFTAADALETIRHGASLVQLWTGFIYEGPGCVRRINKGLVRACQKNGWANISEAVGLDA